VRLTLLIAAVSMVFASAPALSKTEPAYIVVDVGRGIVMGHNDSDRRWPPASVTKLMTAYLTFRALKSGQIKLTSPVVISAHALAEPPSKMGYKAGTVITVDNALKMMLVRSANDIAMAIAETIGGSEAKFVVLMNAEARRLGMNGTTFRNPNGLPADGQYSTARDLAVLARAIWMEYPEFRDYFQITAIRAGNKVLRSYNTLLDHYRGANGMKTGFVCASGFNVVASATRNGRTVMVVVLGETSAAARAETAAGLLNRAFNGGLGGFAGQDLSRFRVRPAAARPVDLYEEICGKARAKTSESDDAVSALGPRFVTMEPVKVFTGGADPVGAAPAATPAAATPSPGGEVNIPLPRPRPQYPAGASAASRQIAQ